MMGQQEVLDLLENESMLSSKEIATKLNKSRESVMASIKRLIQQNEIGKINVPRKSKKILFKYFTI